MLADDHIKRLQADLDGIDFDGFRRQGVELLQALSGQTWTDYNIHDPGVTLLEILCYGLTDLVYRSGFSVADFLTQESGGINFEHQALYRPQDILPIRPVTAIDYCKLIYDHVPEIDDIWIQTDNQGEKLEGLFSIYVKLHQPLSEIEQRSPEDVRQDIIALYANNRNLCQDLDQVYIVQTDTYFLTGEIEIDDSRPAAEIYADIYFQCATLISSGARLTRFEEAVAEGKSWEELLDGPLTRRGYIDDRYFTRTSNNIDVVSLIALVRRMPGVKQVHHLQLIDSQGKKYDHLSLNLKSRRCSVLGFPRSVDQMHLMHLVYTQTGNQQFSTHHPIRQKFMLPQEVSLLEQVRIILKKHEFNHHAFRRHDVNLEELIELPQGEHRPLREYSSIAEHSPAIYGINHYGVPGSEPPEVHARARQLKGFLFAFEQMMANYLQSLQGIPDLYSLDTDLKQSYFSQLLGNQQIPLVETLYRNTLSPSLPAEILSKFDPFIDRRNRVLDSMLAMYGESFPADALRRFNVYHHEHDDQTVIDSKIKFLAHIRELSAQRGAAMNVHAPYWTGANRACLQHKLLLLLGCGETSLGRSLTAHFSSASPAFVSAKTYEKKLGEHPKYKANDSHALPLPLQKTGETTVVKRLPHDMICVELLRAGVDLQRYRLVERADKKVWLCLEVEPDKPIWHLIPLPRDQAVNYAHGLRQRLVELSQQSEGLHVLEHLLLRPASQQLNRDVEDGFYEHRVSIVLPSYTARFADPACRAWVEELIAQNLPAHILPEIHWLDYVYMRQFEQRYNSWLELLNQTRRSGQPAEGLDQTADDIITLLRVVRQNYSPQHWL